MSFPWTDELTETARRLYFDEGKSAQAVAAIIGHQARLPLTRNAVIGKMNRAHGSLRKTDRIVRQMEGRTRAKDKPSVALRRAAERARGKAAPSPAPKTEPPPAAVPEAVQAIAKPLLLLGSQDCRWPIGVGDGEVLFCAAPKAGEGSYCAHHYKRSIQPATNSMRMSEVAKTLRRYA